MATMVFTKGNDTFSHTSAASDTLIFLEGNDRLNVFAGTVIAVMGEGDDLIDLRGGTTEAYGESGEDRFELSVGATVHGGGDDDLFSIRGGNGHIIYGDDGDDRINFGAAAAGVLIFGGTGEEDFSGYDFASTGSIYGGSGNDRFTGFRAGMTLYGEAGNDVYRVNPGSNASFVELADDGKDTVQVMRGGDFTLPDNIENLVVGTYAGSDTTTATLTGNALDNAMTGHGNAETFHGLDGDDRIYGKGGDDTLNGDDGNDILDGGSGNDTLNGGAGNDRLNGRVGDDTMNGGTGNDIYWVDSISDVVTENPGEGTDTVRSVISIQIGANVENGVLEGTADLILYGNELGNILYGNSGNNTVYGWDGNDIVHGGAGNDVVSGLNGTDEVFGDAGDDILYAYSGVDTMTGGTGSDTFSFVDASYSTAAEVDHIVDWVIAEGDVIDLSQIDANTALAGDQAFAWNSTSGPAANSAWYTFTGSGGNFDLTIFADVNGDTTPELQFTVHLTGFFTVGTDIIL